MSLSCTELVGSLVRLEPLSPQHIDGLVIAAAEARDSYGFTDVPAGSGGMVADVEAQLALLERGAAVPFAQVVGDRPVGMTRFLNLRFLPAAQAPFAVEIGGTWLAASAQRTGINTEAKLLLLRQAFDHWGVARVDWKTDHRNARSRTAILALGASFEGVLRCWQPSAVAGEEQLLRDTAMYSVLAPEWPAVRQGLLARLARHAC